MKKLNGPMIVFIVIAIIFYNIFDGEEVTEFETIEFSSEQNNLVSYSQRGVDNTWPPMETGTSQVSDNLMAKNYYLVVDGSGSMRDSGCSNGKEKLQVAKQALGSFVDKLPSDANIGVFAFDNNGRGERLALGKHGTGDIKRAINSINAGGGTPLSQGIEAGTAVLTKQAKQQLGYGEYNLVVVTDGEASNNYEPDNAVRQLLAGSPIVLHTIGFCIDDRHSLNQPGYTLYKAANNPEALLAGLESVLAEAPDFQIADFGQ